MDKTRNHPALNLLLVAILLYGLYIGKYLLIPLVMGVVLWYFINAIGAQIGRIKVGGMSAPKWLRTTLAVLVVVSFFFGVGDLVVANLEQFAEVAPQYNEKFQALSTHLSEQYDIPTIDEINERIDIAQVAADLLNSSFSFLSALLVVIFYVVFMMIEQGIFNKKLDLIFHNNRREKLHFFQTTERIDHSMRKYISVKSFIALIVSICCHIVLISFGVDFAILWAFLTFLLNFIPFIGPFIAILFPTVLSLLQFGDPWISLGIFAILNGIQVVMGNYIEPKMVGKSLNLSPLVVVLALAFWGALWGVAGMFLCVPITVALMIILSQFPATRTAAILLSAGNDPAKDADDLTLDDQE